MPAAIAGDVDEIAGLSSEPARSGAIAAGPTARPANRPGALPAADPGQGPIAGFGPVDFAKAYDMVPFYGAGYLGEAQTIAIISFATFNPDDVATYDSTYGIDASPVERIAVGDPIRSLTDDMVETALDVEVVHAIAPHAGCSTLKP